MTEDATDGQDDGGYTGDATDGTLEEGPPSGPSRARRPSGRAISMMGVLFLVLAALSVVGTVVVMHYDVWVGGADEESVGDRQTIFIYLGLVGLIVFAILAVWDIMRRRG